MIVPQRIRHTGGKTPVLRRLRLGALLLAAAVSSCRNTGDEETPTEAPETPTVSYIDYQVAATHPHDSTLFTEGLLFYNDTLYESTGSPEDLPDTRSLIGRYDPVSFRFQKLVELKDRNYFGEGISILNGKLYQLTYKNGTCYVYGYPKLNRIDSLRFDNKEGWGLTTDGTQFIMSDGTDKLDYKDPQRFTTIKKINVTENGYAVENLNELEFVKGFIYANVWMTNTIVKIDPATGRVVGKIDLTRLYDAEQRAQPHIDVLNGIAYNPKNDQLYVTGKLWKSVYALKLAQ